MLAGPRGLASPIPVHSFTSMDALMIVGTTDWPVCATDGAWSRRPLGNVDQLSGTRARGKAIKKPVYEQICI